MSLALPKKNSSQRKGSHTDSLTFTEQFHGEVYWKYYERPRKSPVVESTTSKVAVYRPTTLVKVSSTACVFLGIHKVLIAPFSRSTFGRLLLRILLNSICKWSLIDER